jgi:hypothetical protein
MRRLDFDGKDIGATRKSQRTVAKRRTNEELAEAMLSFLHRNYIPNRCELISPESYLQSIPGKCSQSTYHTKKDCTLAGHTWTSQRSSCRLDGPPRVIRAATRETLCPICQVAVLDSSNRWGCHCAHPICNACFQSHVKKTGYKCPVCHHFCDEDKICRNFDWHEAEIEGVHQPIYCPICRQECTQCFSLQIRE